MNNLEMTSKRRVATDEIYTKYSESHRYLNCLNLDTLNLQPIVGFLYGFCSPLSTIDQNILPRMGAAILEESAEPLEKFPVGGLLPAAPEALKCTERSTLLDCVTCTANVPLFPSLKILTTDTDRCYI